MEAKDHLIMSGVELSVANTRTDTLPFIRDAVFNNKMPVKEGHVFNHILSCICLLPTPQPAPLLSCFNPVFLKQLKQN